MVDAPKLAVSPGASGTLIGVQFVAVFQLFVAGAAFQVCAFDAEGKSTIPQRTAIDEASSRVGRGDEGFVESGAVIGARLERFILKVFSWDEVKWEWDFASRDIFPTRHVASFGFSQFQNNYRTTP